MEEKSNNDNEVVGDHHAIDVGVARCTFVLSFRNLTYSVKNPKRAERRRNGGRTRILLNSVTGEARGGEILAILGTSGSGKSTLIDALANRIAKGSLKGSITLNGEILEGRLLKSISAYVMQDDLLFPMLTVEETLMFSAEFRLPQALSAAKKAARVKALINQLGLQLAAKTIIGDEGHRGVSGGERRRVSIGIDIIHDPVILFLDEPTSGLDSTSAFLVVKALRRIAQSGSIVVMSVHQPSSRILGVLDRLMFISRGHTVYFGSPDGLPSYFSSFGHPIPDSDNQTELVLDLIRELESSDIGPNQLVEFNNSWQSKRASPQNRFNTVHGSLLDMISERMKHGKLVSSSTTFANPFWIEILVLAKRSLTNACRMPELFGMRLTGVLVTGFILATIFWKLDNTPMGVKERFSFFAFSMSTVFYTCVDVLPALLQERYIFMRETAYNAYRRSSYVLSNALISLLPLLVLSAAFAITTFFAVGLAGGTSGFLFFFSTIFASFWAGISFVTFLSAVMSQVMVGYTVAVGILAYFLLFSGFFINRQRIPGYWIWFHYLSLVKYPYEAVLQNEFDDASKCFARGVQIFDNTMMASLSEAMKTKALDEISGALGMTITENSCVTTGMDVLKEQGLMDLSKWSCLWVTVAWGFFFQMLFYFALFWGSKNKRR